MHDLIVVRMTNTNYFAFAEIYSKSAFFKKEFDLIFNQKQSILCKMDCFLVEKLEMESRRGGIDDVIHVNKYTLIKHIKLL